VSEPNGIREEIWAYVHNALGADERRSFEARMSKDRELQRAVDETRALDETLRESLRLAVADSSEQELEDRILAAYEQADPEPAEADPTHPLWRGLLRRLQSRPVVYPWVLAAACVLLAVGLATRMPGPLRWSAEFSGPVYRGPTAPARAFPESLLSQALEQLKQDVWQQYAGPTGAPRRAWFRGRARWQISALFQEWPDSHLIITIEVHARDGAHLGTWSATARDAESVDRELAALATPLAEALVRAETDAKTTR
jgi:anti-sigma factor RsiW